MIFGKRSTPEAPQAERSSSEQTVYSSQLAGEGLEREYEELVRTHLVKLGVPLDTVEVEVRTAGAMHDGRNIYLGMVRLTKWNPRTSMRLLVALPLLEVKTRQSLETSWLVDVSHFGGLWVHASSNLRTGEVMGDIRDAITRLELNATTSGGEGWSASVQATLDDPDRVRAR